MVAKFVLSSIILLGLVGTALCVDYCRLTCNGKKHIACNNKNVSTTYIHMSMNKKKYRISNSGVLYYFNISF